LRRALAADARRLLLRGQWNHLFDMKAIERLIARHEQGQGDLSESLFTLSVFASWHRVFIEPSLSAAPVEALDA
jgi:hypothetical protein